MDAKVQLALIEKAKRVFAPDAGTMLSFPLLSPLTFTPGEIDALSSPDTTADYIAAGDFSRTVNFLPTDLVATATERMLWDVYRDVLERAEVACGSAAATAPSPADAALLYTAGPDGTPVESEAATRYRQYRDAWIVACEDYASHALTGQLSTDDAVRRQWTEVEEPALRAKRDAALEAWKTLGGRAAIERAREAERAAAAADPRLRWKEWVDGFDADLDMLTDTTGFRFPVTGVSPVDFARSDAWLHFDLSGQEIETLAAGAPERLRGMLGNGADGAIESVSFDYRSVAIVRPWFRPDVFTSRLWRTSDPGLALSDGGDPAAGACPAYATAMVFIRNLKVVERGFASPRPFRLLKFTLMPQVGTTRAALVRRLPAMAAAAPPPEPAPAAHRQFQRLAAAGFALAPARLSAAGQVRRALEAERSTAVFATSSIRLPHEVFGNPPPPPPAEPEPPDDSLSVLAFICRRLPKAPDPMIDLRWS